MAKEFPIMYKCVHISCICSSTLKKNSDLLNSILYNLDSCIVDSSVLIDLAIKKSHVDNKGNEVGPY